MGLSFLGCEVFVPTFVHDPHEYLRRIEGGGIWSPGHRQMVSAEIAMGQDPGEVFPLAEADGVSSRDQHGSILGQGCGQSFAGQLGYGFAHGPKRQQGALSFRRDGVAFRWGEEGFGHGLIVAAQAWSLQINADPSSLRHGHRYPALRMADGDVGAGAAVEGLHLGTAMGIGGDAPVSRRQQRTGQGATVEEL